MYDDPIAWCVWRICTRMNSDEKAKRIGNI